jgi:hypothetical protein
MAGAAVFTRSRLVQSGLPFRRAYLEVPRCTLASPSLLGNPQPLEKELTAAPFLSRLNVIDVHFNGGKSGASHCVSDGVRVRTQCTRIDKDAMGPQLRELPPHLSECCTNDNTS